LVSLASVILVTGIGLALFFSKDIIDFLNSLKGFGTGDINVSLVPEGAVPTIPAVPEQGIAKEFLDVLGGVGAGEAVEQAGVVTRTAVDQAVFDLTQGVDNLTQQAKTQIGEVELGFQQTQTNIADFFTGVSEGFTSFFGGQQEPKIILTQETVSDPTILQRKAGVFEPKSTTLTKPEAEPIITAEQPDPSLVSPFLTLTQPKDPETLLREIESETLTSGTKTRGELRFGR